MRDLTPRSRLAVQLASAAAVAVLLLGSVSTGSGQNASDPFHPFGEPTQPPANAPATPVAPAAPARAPQKKAAPAPAPTPANASPVIARVGGRPITQMDFDRAAAPYFAKLRSQFGKSFDTDVKPMATKNVIDELVRRELVAVEAKRLGIEPTVAEMDSILMPDPMFQTNGRFDPGKLAAFKISPQANYNELLPRLREMAATKKLDGMQIDRFKPKAAELKAEFAKRNDLVRFDVLPLLQRDVTLDPEADDAEVAAYYAAHPDQFTRRARVRLGYAKFALPPAGDSTRAATMRSALASAQALADSLRTRTLADSSVRLLDTGLFDVPAVFVPVLGRAPGIVDALTKAESDASLRVLGPDTTGDAVIVAVIRERQPKSVQALRDVFADAKRRADAEKRRTNADSERRAYFAAHREDFRGPRVLVTRLTWPAADSARAANVATALLSGLRAGRDARALAQANGAVLETLSFVRRAMPDTLFTQPLVDSLLDAQDKNKGVWVGPRTFATRRVLWRVEGYDASWLPTYELVRATADQRQFEDRQRRDEGEAHTHFEAHRADYRTPEKFALDYIFVRPPLADSVDVPEAELRRAYTARAATFRQEEEVRARHILFMAQDGDAAKGAKAKARADSLLAAIRKNGGDFGELAKRFSQEPGADKSGGELGWFGRGRMVREFEQAAFALKPGEISEVVHTQFGYHIIELEERKAAGTRPFEEVRGALRTELAGARADSIAKRTAETLRAALVAGGDPAVLGAKHGGLVAATPIASTEAVPNLGVAQGLTPDLGTLHAGQWAPHAYRVAGGWMVTRLRERQPPRPALFEEVKNQAIDDMKTAKRRTRYAEKLAALRAGLAAGASIDSLAMHAGGLKESGFLTAAASFVPGVGAEPRVVQRAFSLAPGAVSDTIEVAQGVVWIRTVEKKGADAAAFKLAAPQLESEILGQRYAAWVEERKKTVKVEILRADLRATPKPVTKTLSLGN